MGPNYYLNPPGGFTQFHQDRQGTVDSGYLCLEDYNEVVMLHRKKHALTILKCDDRREQSELKYDALCGLPHHDVSKKFFFFMLFLSEFSYLNIY